jgi:hypothetical protein
MMEISTGTHRNETEGVIMAKAATTELVAPDQIILEWKCDDDGTEALQPLTDIPTVGNAQCEVCDQSMTLVGAHIPIVTPF